MLPAATLAMSPPCLTAVRAAANTKPSSARPPKRSQPQNLTTTAAAAAQGFGGKRKDPVWQCIQNCGACCKLDKGPTFPTPEEFFDDPSDIELYKSMVGEDGWCINYDKGSRKCSIYAERPYFCRVEPGIFEALYGIDKKKFNKEACSCCVDTIKAVYGTNSQELEEFNQAIWSSSQK
ncbi:hypothetical protein STAS_35099 [Striga asiatica]|uniref:Flagellin N-methylase family protein n=1 Tax=Striga asiatica TaxID=4170 RepID=A0A5A7RJE4_STRAF|nr:hypothetical protein STAS_35099 [Striga asiatica]